MDDLLFRNDLYKDNKRHYINLQYYKLILITSSKGGSGKSLITFCIAAYLASIYKKVKIVNFDFQNSGIHVLNARYFDKEPSPLKVEDMDKDLFFRTLQSYKDETEGYDYILEDGYYDHEFLKLHKMAPHIPRVYFIISTDTTFDWERCKKLLIEYLVTFKGRLRILLNNKINDIKQLKKIRIEVLLFLKEHNIQSNLCLIELTIPFIKLQYLNLEIVQALGKEICHSI